MNIVEKLKGFVTAIVDKFKEVDWEYVFLRTTAWFTVVMLVLLIVFFVKEIVLDDDPAESWCIDGYEYLIGTSSGGKGIVQVWENGPDGPRPAMCKNRKKEK